MRACRQEVEGERREHARGEKAGEIAPPAQRHARADEARHEKERPRHDEGVVGLPEVEGDGPAVEGVERRVRVGLRRAADEVDELAHDGYRVGSVEGRGGGREHARRGSPRRVADEVDSDRDDDDPERYPELRLHQRGEGGEHAGRGPTSRARGHDRREEGQGPDGVDLTPVRSGEDRTGLQ